MGASADVGKIPESAVGAIDRRVRRPAAPTLIVTDDAPARESVLHAMRILARLAVERNRLDFGARSSLNDAGGAARAAQGAA